MKYLIMCNRHESVFGDNFALFWGYREQKSDYISDVRLAHRFDESEIKEFDNDDDIPVPINLLGLSEGYEENINEKVKMLVEKGTIYNLLNAEGC